jgi:hypothetical protein
VSACERCQDTRLIEVIKKGNLVPIPCPECYEGVLS